MEPPPRAKFLGRGSDLARNRELTGPWRVTQIPGKASWNSQVWSQVAPAGLSSGPRSPLSLAMITHGPGSQNGPAGGAMVFGTSREGSRAVTPSGSPKQLLHTFTSPAMAPPMPPPMAAVAEGGP